MIFQIGLNLNIQNQDVQAVVDLDTGLIGFVEQTSNGQIEYAYQQSPPNFKKALLDVLLENAAEKNFINMKISRKGACAAMLNTFWEEN